MLFSNKQPRVSLSKSVATELDTSAEHRHHTQLSDSQYQEQDSSSTLSAGQSHAQNALFQPGSTETYKERGENCVEPSVPSGNPDYLRHQVQMEHNQSLDWMSYPLAAPCFGRITAAYEPNSIVYPQMMGVAPARVVIPLDCTQGIPIYVNAKQYHAIVRRRQTRAKLEAQNKVAKSRKSPRILGTLSVVLSFTCSSDRHMLQTVNFSSILSSFNAGDIPAFEALGMRGEKMKLSFIERPYLHESRHRHASRRTRGSGGRFLNKKNSPQSKPSTQTSDKNLIQLIRKEPQIQHSESNSWGTSTTSGSDSSCIFNNDDIFQPPDLRVTNSLMIAGSRSIVVAPEDMLLLSIDRCG